MWREGGQDLDEKMRWLFLTILGRSPAHDELALMAELHAEQLNFFKNDPKQADAFLKVGDLAAPADIPATELAAGCVLASALLNLDEAITLR
jgi:hypothetical protein